MKRYEIKLESEARLELEKQLKLHTTEYRLAERAKIILLSADGMSLEAIASKLDCSQRLICKWRRRYCENGLAGLQEMQRPGRPCTISPETFAEKFWDVIGLYLDPPERALVLCCDEKSQIQALERTQPGLPLGVGHIRTQTHDYYRHGTTTLFAALNYLDGKIISRTEERHRHIEWLRFLRQIERETPRKLDIHIVLDNYGSHKHPKVMAWLEKHPRFHLHFTPTSASWLNLVERFFRDVHMDVVKHGSFTHLSELNDALQAYMEERNSSPKRYVWRADGHKILEKINRARQVLKERQ